MGIETVDMRSGFNLGDRVVVRFECGYGPLDKLKIDYTLAGRVAAFDLDGDICVEFDEVRDGHSLDGRLARRHSGWWCNPEWVEHEVVPHEINAEDLI